MIVHDKLDVVDGDLYTDVKTQNVLIAMGVEANVVDDLAEVGYVHVNGRVGRNRKIFTKPDWRNWLLSRLMAVWHFTMFTESRFCSFGVCSRSMIAALATGFGVVVEALLGKKEVPQYFIKGWRRFAPRLRRSSAIRV